MYVCSRARADAHGAVDDGKRVQPPEREVEALQFARVHVQRGVVQRAADRQQAAAVGEVGVQAGREEKRCDCEACRRQCFGRG